MLVGLAEFEAYIKAYLEYSSRYIRIIDSSIRNRIFQKCLLQPYRIVGTVSVKHGVSIEFVEQTSKYEFEVTKIEEKTVRVRCGEVEIVLKLAD